MLKKYGWIAGLVLLAAVVAIFFLSSGDETENETATGEEAASPEMVENVEALEAEIRRVREAEGEAAACQAVDEAQKMIFMATEVAWLHRNPGPELRPVYHEALEDGTPMRKVFDYDAGEGSLVTRYREWDEYDRDMAQLKTEMASTVSGEYRARSLAAICEISETNPYGFALVTDVLDELSGEMSCGG
jgi:hypothetical protein